MSNQTIDPSGKPAKLMNFRISDIDKTYLEDRFEITGLHQSAYIRMLIKIDREANSKKFRLDEIKRRKRKLKIELSFLDSEEQDIINELEARKKVVDNRDQAINKEIEALMPSLIGNLGNLKEIERFIKIRVTTLNNNFKNEGINPLTVEEFTNMLRDHAEAQGVSCL